MDEDRAGRRRLRLCLPFILAAVALSGCAEGERKTQETLMDGSPAPDVPVELEGVDQPTVLTLVRVVRGAKRKPETASASCLRGRDWGIRAAGPSVERVGVYSESVTFRQESRRGIFGCDNSPGPREESRRWCSGAYGTLYSGHLRDPRLDIICQATDGSLIGFVWVEPSPGTRFVAVAQPEYTEVYEVAAGLPVRVATTRGVDDETSSAVFDISEHDAAGKLLRSYELRAQVAG